MKKKKSFIQLIERIEKYQKAVDLINYIVIFKIKNFKYKQK